MAIGMEGSTLGVWVAHGEGRPVYASETVFSDLDASGLLPLRYVDNCNNPTTAYPFNPNGAEGGVAGLVSTCGRHLAIMPHPGRYFVVLYLASSLLIPVVSFYY